MKRGKFIALEGIDGSGKSSQIGPLVRRLAGLGVPCRETREPTGGPVGSLIRQIFTGRVTADNRVIAALYAADRIDHLVNEVDGLLSALDQGITVVSDRYYFSSYAYHSVDADMDWVIQANALSAQLLRPTLTVFLDVPVETALARIRENRFVEEIFDGEDRLRRTRELYFQAFERLRDVERVAVVDGTGSQEQVGQRIWEAVAPYFPEILN
ncbi:MAG: dTMP kinase [Oscillospiraceae bacterium]|nr:dTMP kinase [Oscillospiraceae bacterium]